VFANALTDRTRMGGRCAQSCRILIQSFIQPLYPIAQSPCSFAHLPLHGRLALGISLLCITSYFRLNQVSRVSQTEQVIGRLQHLLQHGSDAAEQPQFDWSSAKAHITRPSAQPLVALPPLLSS
jgi:hypothetical protein